MINQFEKEKDAEINEELGNQIKIPDIKQGWNEWAGVGVNN